MTWDAGTYDRVSDPQFRWAAPVIDRLPADVGSLLDAGCGSGRVTEVLLRRLPEVRVIALDASADMLAEAARRLAAFTDRVTFVHADLSRPLDLPEPVDAVFSTAAFHWISDHAALFRHLAGVLRPGGRLVAQWGGGGNIASVRAVLREVGDGWTGPWTFATPEETERDLEAAGFVDVRAWVHDEPESFESRESFTEFIRTVILCEHLGRLRAWEHDAFVDAVVDRLPSLVVDYVRLNATATLGAR